MRRNYLMKSIGIILMLLAMMFSCQPVSEDVDSGNSNSNNTSQGGNTGGGNNEEDKPVNPQTLTLQQIINDTNAGDEIDLSKYKDVTDYNATVNKSLTIKNGALKNAKLSVTAENVKLEKLEKLSVSTSSRLTINNSKLSDLLIGTSGETSRSGTLSTEMSLAMASITGCEIENVELIGFNSQLNITDVKTKINDIIISTKAKIILEAGSYEGMKDPTVTDDGELVRIDMTKEKELSVYSIYSHPKKAEYQIGEKFDVSGLVVMGTYTASMEIFKSGGWKGEAVVDSVTKWESEKDYTVTCEDFSTAGVKIVTITSNIDTKVKCNFYVYVKDPQNTEIKEPEITEIELRELGTPKTLYKVGEKLDLSGFQVSGTYNGFEINLPYRSEPANGTTLTTVGETTVTLYYNGEKVAEFPITVENAFLVEFYDGIDNSKPLYTQKVTAGDGLKLPSLPERENFTFVGWYDGETKFESGYVITGDLNLTAKWDKLTTIEVATDEVASTIANLSAGIYKLVAMGEMTPDMLTSIAESMKNNSSAEITLDLSGTTGLTEIPDEAFGSCSSLTSVTIPDSVTTIGDGAFFGCENLASVTIPDSVTSIGYGAFSGCSSLTSVIIPDGVTTIGGSAFGSCYSLASIIIPDSVTTIGDYAFYRCENLASVTIPDSVTNIGDYAFYYCNSLTKVTIPDSVITIGYYAFSDCYRLASITFADTNNWYYTDNDDYTGGTKIDVTDSEQNAYNLSIDEHLCYSYWYKHVEITGTADNVAKEISKHPLGSYTVAVTGAITNDTVSAIKNALQNNSSAMVSLDLSGTTGLIEIPDEAFDSCNNLTNVIIPDGVTTIGYYAFSSCSSLTSVTIPDSVTSIGYSAFSGCSSLTSVTIPDSVTTIGGSAFDSCYSLASITIPDSVTTIGDSAFYNCNSLTKVTIPDSVTTIGDSAFFGCDNLASVTIPDSVTTIGDSAFYNCSSLTSVTIPDSVTIIGDMAFVNCVYLTNITIGKGLSSIGQQAFAYIPSTFTVDSGNENFSTSEDGKILYNKDKTTLIASTAIGDITIPASVTVINMGALFNPYCKLTSVTFADTTSTWYYTNNEDLSDGTVIDVTDPALNATNLASSDSEYYNKYWYKAE